MTEDIKVGAEGGHGGYGVTPGKRTPDGEYEWDFNNIVVSSFLKELSLYEGVVTKRFDDPTGKRDVPLKERTDGANKWGADYYFSFHHNAFKSKWGTHTGVETWICPNAQSESVKLANAIHPAVVKGYGLRDRGIKKGNLHIVRETFCPAILIEGGFMDSTIDIKVLRNKTTLENVGKQVAVAFAEFKKLKKKQKVQVATKTKKRKRHNVRVYWFPSDTNSGLVALKKYLDSKKLDYKVTCTNEKYMLESYWYPQDSKGKYELEQWLLKKGFNYDIQLEK